MTTTLDIGTTIIKELVRQPVQRGTGMGTAIVVSQELLTVANYKDLTLFRDPEGPGCADLDIMQITELH